jgi:pimeloyl-ACP methyl ester carboxylesterase
MPRAAIGDVELYYEVHGEERGGSLPVLLIMGLGTDLGGWELTVPALSPERRVVVFDNRGMGRSDKPSGRYTTRQMAADARVLLDTLEIPRAHVVGISMGGMIAQELALAAPGRVASLVLAATYMKPDEEIQKTSEAGAGAAFSKGPRLDMVQMGKMLDAMQAGGAEAAAAASSTAALDPLTTLRFLMPLVFSKAYLEKERDFLKHLFERQISYGFEPRGFLGQVSAVWTHDTTDRIAALAELPVLVVLGDKDRLVPPRLTRALHAAIPNARLAVVEGGTHGLMFEFEAEWNRIIKGWLAEHDREAPPEHRSY